jgi:hypothetical protein
MSIDIVNTGIDHVLNGMAIKYDWVQALISKIFPVTEDRDYSVCCAKQMVLADATGIANQNDVNGFLFKLSLATDTLDLFLEKDSVQIAQLNTATYGTPYALGSITYYTDQALLAGYSLEWSKVLSAHGAGNYRIRADYTTLGTPASYYSNDFILYTYSTSLANGTIRIESYMDGYIMRDDINYKGMNFVDMIRVRGWFGNPEEKLVTTNDIFANYSGEKRVVVQRKVNQVDEYMLEILPIPKCISDKIRYYHFLANTIYVSDYNYTNYDWGLQRIRVYKEEAFTFKYTKTTRGIVIRGKLTEQIQNLQKTNC